MQWTNLWGTHIFPWFEVSLSKLSTDFLIFSLHLFSSLRVIVKCMIVFSTKVFLYLVQLGLSIKMTNWYDLKWNEWKAIKMWNFLQWPCMIWAWLVESTIILVKLFTLIVSYRTALKFTFSHFSSLTQILKPEKSESIE